MRVHSQQFATPNAVACISVFAAQRAKLIQALFRATLAGVAIDEQPLSEAQNGAPNKYFDIAGRSGTRAP